MWIATTNCHTERVPASVGRNQSGLEKKPGLHLAQNPGSNWSCPIEYSLPHTGHSRFILSQNICINEIDFVNRFRG